MIILGCSVFLPLHKDKAVLKILKVSCANTYIDTKDQNYYVSVLTFKTIGKFPTTYLWIHILILLVCECLCCYSFTNTMSKTYPHSLITRESQPMSTYSLQVCVFWEFPAHDFWGDGSYYCKDMVNQNGPCGSREDMKFDSKQCFLMTCGWHTVIRLKHRVTDEPSTTCCFGII